MTHTTERRHTDMAGTKLEKIPVREQEPKVRAANFNEVCLGYNLEEATAPAI